MVNELGLGLGVLMTVAAVVLHLARGTAWTTGDDISADVMERRAATVPETGFPEPMSRAIGGGAVAIGGLAGGELEEGEQVGEEETTPSPADIPEDEIEYFDVEFVKEGTTIEVANNESLLEAGEDEGWDLPYACRQGQCLSCGAHLAGGSPEDVVHDNQEVLSDDELSEGYILTCVAYPRGDISIETRETP